MVLSDGSHNETRLLMNRPQLLSHGLRRLRPVQVRSGTRGIVTAADVDKARKYCQRQLQHSDYDAHLIQRTLPTHVRDAYLALRTLNLELVRLPEVVTNPTIGAMRMQFWRESIDKTFAGNPPAEPTCVLLHEAVTSLQSRGGGSSRAAATQMKFWIQRVIRTRERHMDNRPFATLASLEEYAENTYATLMYATLAALPVQSVHADHLASHIGKAAGIVAVLRGVPVLAAPQPAVAAPDGSAAQVGRGRDPVLLLPLDVLAEADVREEDVFRRGPAAAGFQDAIFAVATRANDHLITAREMLKNLRLGKEAGHAFEHEGEEGHVYAAGESDAVRDIRQSSSVLMEAVPPQEYLTNLEKVNFNPFAVRASWKLPWSIWRAGMKQQI
ncbi:hypothetical protein HYQ45_000104 [Verticillium longisporum]|uniref:Phytoene synthase n=1 Tax=Verticillium longisporum TaxID=100787 RepID=A0A8I3AXT4_VERLO|nr:hypothetical protein HYQ45_000104 [Verticillium longisporum]